MKVGVIGSGSIGPDLAYGFLAALANQTESKVYLVDIKQDALEAGIGRIKKYIQKGLVRGKVNLKTAKQMEANLVATTALDDLASCDYVIESATEDLVIKQEILKNLESVVREDCLIGFATSGIPRAHICAHAKVPDRCFVNHPFYPAWRALPIEIVVSDDETLSKRMIQTLRQLGKVPIVTKDVACFAADDVFCNYCAEAARLVSEGIATPKQIDSIVNAAVGGGGPFNVMDLTRGNLLNVHCLELMKEAETGNDWFTPPEIFSKQANTPWLDSKDTEKATYDETLRRTVLDRILAVLFGRTYFVVDQKICDPTSFNWLSRNALGFNKGLLDIAEDFGPTNVAEICQKYAAQNPGYEVPDSIKNGKLGDFYRCLIVENKDDIAIVRIFRPEVKNALNENTMKEIRALMEEIESNDKISGVILTSFDGAIAGADIMELAALKTPTAAEEKCLQGQAVLNFISAMKTPVVAAIDGPILGGGAELSMACHGRVVGTNLMLGQPEVNLGIIPGYGGTQRLPRLMDFEQAIDLLRTGRVINAKKAYESGWATIEPVQNPELIEKAVDLIRQHKNGKLNLKSVNPEPISIPNEWPLVNIGHHSLAIDSILMQAVKDGLRKPLHEGLKVEAKAFAECKQTIDYNIGMTNFIQNGPRVPAVFLHE